VQGANTATAHPRSATTTHGAGATAAHPASAAPAHAGSAAAAQATSAGTGHAASAHKLPYEPRDPEESRSFPEPATVQHAPAEAPGEAGQLIPAAGAASDAEIQRELNQVAEAERATSRQALTAVPGGESVGGNGTIPIPAGIPEVVQRVIAGGNAIADFPYIWGGGHGSFIANGYDCSGSVSYALAAGGLVGSPMVSGELARWGDPGPGRWITIYANVGHTFMDVDGVWFDTAGRSGPYTSRWLVAQPPLEGYAVRHPPGL
jgi:cell wall-associated NlpC family hydrolase